MKLLSQHTDCHVAVTVESCRHEITSKQECLPVQGKIKHKNRHAQKKEFRERKQSAMRTLRSGRAFSAMLVAKHYVSSCGKQENY